MNGNNVETAEGMLAAGQFRDAAGRSERAILLQLKPLQAAAASSDSQKVEVERGSPLRTEILNAVRPLFERETNGAIEFTVRHLNVLGDWAFGEVGLQRPAGRAIDWRRTKFRDAYAAGTFFPDHTLFLLKRNDGRWSIAEYVVGPSDPVWEDWITARDLPRSLFE